MKNIKQIGFSIALMALFTACGGGGGGGSDAEPTITTTNMEINTSYIIQEGGVVTKTSDDATIDMETSFDTNETTVTLKSGTATCTQCSLEQN